VMHVGDLGAAEPGIRHLIDLARDLLVVDQRVGPPPAELGLHGPARLREVRGEIRRVRGGRGDHAAQHYSKRESAHLTLLQS